MRICTFIEGKKWKVLTNNKKLKTKNKNLQKLEINAKNQILKTKHKVIQKN